RTWRSACSAARRKASRSPVVRYLRAPSSVCSAMPVCGREAGVTRLVERAIWSCAALLVAAAALSPCKAGERIDGGTRVGMRIQPAAAFGADAAPLTKQQSAAEQIGSDLHAVEAPLVALGTNADQRGSFREQRQLDRCGKH